MLLGWVCVGVFPVCLVDDKVFEDDGGGIHTLYAIKEFTPSFLTVKFMNDMGTLEWILVEIVGYDEILSLHVVIVDYKLELITWLCTPSIVGD